MTSASALSFQGWSREDMKLLLLLSWWWWCEWPAWLWTWAWDVMAEGAMCRLLCAVEDQLMGRAAAKGY